MGELTTAVQNRQNPKQHTVAELIKRQESQIARALPRHITADRFARIVMTEVNRTPRLLECEPVSLLASVMLAAQLGLEPGQPLGLSWIIPYRNNRKGTTEAQFQVGAEGFVELAWRAASIIVEPRIVWEGDDYQEPEHGPGGTKWYHRETGKATRNWTHVYAVARYPDGREYMESMSRDQVIAHRDRYVRDWNKPGSAWRDSEPEMARKTVMKRLAKRLPKSPEIRTALIADETTPNLLVPDIAGAIEDTAGQVIDVEEVDDPNVSDAELVDDEEEADSETRWAALADMLAAVPTVGTKAALLASMDELGRRLQSVGLLVPSVRVVEEDSKDDVLAATAEYWDAARRIYADADDQGAEG